MAITYNGTNITNWTYNSTTGIVTYNGTQIWPTETKNWVFITSYSSEPGFYNVFLSSHLATSSAEAKSLLEAAYPASNQALGNIGIVYDQLLVWYEFEVQ